MSASMMSRAAAVAGRELRAYFLSPAGYIIPALFMLVVAAVFCANVFGNGRVASMRPVLGVGTWLLTFIAPAITMRLASEEFRLGTYETLVSAPLREWEVIAGKFIGALAFLLTVLAPTALLVLAMEAYGRPDYGELACGYLGLLVAATAYLATGLFTSTLTSSQPVAFLLALFFWLAVATGAKILPPYLDEQWARRVFALDPDLRLREFSIGLIDTSNVVYFLSIAVVFLIAATQSLRVRRWQ